MPPVVRYGCRAQIGSASIMRSPLWANMRRRRLPRNLRLAEGAEEFGKYPPQLGEGEALIKEWEDSIERPADICAGAAHVADPYAEIGRAVFPDI